MLLHTSIRNELGARFAILGYYFYCKFTGLYHDGLGLTFGDVYGGITSS